MAFYVSSRTHFRIGLLILAAGASVRMGIPKQLLTLQGESLIRRAAHTALQTLCEPIVVVLGANGTVIRSETADLPIKIVSNPSWNEGMGSSIRVGIQELLEVQPPLQAAIIMLCDQPLVSAQLIQEMVNSYRTSDAGLVACEYGGQIGVPALFDRSVWNDLLALQGSEGAKTVLHKHKSNLRRIAFPEGFLDVDTPDDYHKIQQMLS